MLSNPHFSWKRKSPEYNNKDTDSSDVTKRCKKEVLPLREEVNVAKKKYISEIY